MGFTVIEAGDGRQAVDVFTANAEAISLVILDLTMPVLDGSAVFAELRRIRPGVRVILSSGYDEVETTRRFSGQGLAGFLQKPYTAAELEEKLSSALRSA
jgi:DNA-binding response OmpR family regulator